MNCPCIGLLLALAASEAPTQGEPGCSVPGVTYVVRAGTASGVGSAKKPFGSVAEGLRAADAARACRVELEVGPGTFPGDLQISRPTLIVGANRGIGPGPTIEGAIRNSSLHPLRLRHLKIAGARGVGIEQRGGELELVEVQITGTLTSGDDPATGTAVRLSGGAKARLSTVVLSRNESRAVLAEGAGTVLHLFDALVEGNQGRPSADETATVEVRDGASLFADKVVIRASAPNGLHLRGNARAHARHVQVSGTTAPASGSAPARGGNVLVSDGAMLELRDFLIRGSAAAGIAVRNAFLTAEDGVIEGNPIGIWMSALPDTDHRWERCIGGSVVFRDNVVKTDPASVPEPECLGSGAATCMRRCRRVPWE